jgi:hypothetical protein
MECLSSSSKFTLRIFPEINASVVVDAGVWAVEDNDGEGESINGTHGDTAGVTFTPMGIFGNRIGESIAENRTNVRSIKASTASLNDCLCQTTYKKKKKLIHTTS